MMVLIPGLPDDIARECLIRVPFKHFNTVSAVCNPWKEEIQSIQFHLLRKARGFTRPILLLTQAHPFGPFKHRASLAYQFTLYEPDTAHWSRLPPIPAYSDGLPLFCQCAGVGRNLVLIGGWNPATWEISNAVYLYDFLSATWRSGAAMPGPPRSFFACASDSNRMVYIAGGHDEEKNALRSAMAFDTVKDEWVSLPDMARPRDECKGIYHDGKFHVIGGYCTEMQGRFEDSAEAFDVDMCHWGKVEKALESGTCPKTCVVDEEGKLYRCLQGQVAILDGATWRVLTQLPDDVRLGTFSVAWQTKQLVIGSARLGGVHKSYVLEVEKGTQSTWQKIDTPEEFTGHVQTGCKLEI